MPNYSGGLIAVFSLSCVGECKANSFTYQVLQRRTESGNWVDLTTQSNLHEFIDNGLIQNTEYIYRDRVNEKRGTYKYSSESWIITATDPAVAAATAAQSAAESAKAFAEQSSIDANIVATNALTASNNTLLMVNQRLNGQNWPMISR